MLKNQEFQTPTIQRIAAFASSRESMKFSIIEFYGKAIIIQKTYNKNRV